MSFNRLKYDSCETKKYNQESTGPGNYLYNTPIDCNMCWNDNPRIINQKVGDSLNSHTDWRFYAGPVDIESDLFNINRQKYSSLDKPFANNEYFSLASLDKQLVYPLLAKNQQNVPNSNIPLNQPGVSNSNILNNNQQNLDSNIPDQLVVRN